VSQHGRKGAIKLKQRRALRGLPLLSLLLLAGTVLGCDRGPALPTTDVAPGARSRSGVELTELQVSEQELTAEAAKGEAKVHLRITTGPDVERGLLGRVKSLLFQEQDAATRHARVQLWDRNGEALMVDSSTLGATSSRTIERFDEEMQVTSGLVEMLKEDRRSFQYFRWELASVGDTAQALLGIHGPSKSTPKP